MGVILTNSRNIPPQAEWDAWVAVTGTNPKDSSLQMDNRLPDTPRRLESAFVRGRNIWWDLGKQLYAQPTGNISHMATCASFGSDFGVMLGWTILANELAQESTRCLIICDDPWLFRALSMQNGVKASKPPALMVPRVMLWLRGYLARFRTAFRLAAASIGTRNHRRNLDGHQAAVLVYGHPTSTADGYDAYFGPLLQSLPSVGRLLHTDCSQSRADELSADGLSASLHGFGSISYALTKLPFVRWRPSINSLSHSTSWLVRRSAAHENSGGGPAMNAWQIHCQQQWLTKSRPKTVVWPWENFAWERALVRDARRMGIKTAGYQHTVVGPHQFNYSVIGSSDGFESIPDRIIANGPAYLGDLITLGIPRNRIEDLGAFRMHSEVRVSFKADAPIFVALSGNLSIARKQIEAARILADADFRVLVKEHPMYPIVVPEAKNLSRTDIPMAQHDELSAVLYATGASGLESLLAGIPAVRLLTSDWVSIDILPSSLSCPSADIFNIVDIMKNLSAPPHTTWNSIFSKPDIKRWRSLLN